MLLWTRLGAGDIMHDSQQNHYTQSYQNQQKATEEGISETRRENNFSSRTR